MSEHLMIYLDESGDLGFDFKKNTNRYFVIGLLLCLDNQTNKSTIQSVKKTLRNKLPKNVMELKGRDLELPVKKYFLKEMRKGDNWCLYVAATDKKAWLDHHNNNYSHTLKKKILYDEVAKRIFVLVDYLNTAKRVDIVIDRSKNKDEISEFNAAVTHEIKKRLPKNAVLTIRHTYSHEEAGLQAIDMFCGGVWNKYEKSDVTWYAEFSDKIATEVEYKF